MSTMCNLLQMAMVQMLISIKKVGGWASRILVCSHLWFAINAAAYAFTDETLPTSFSEIYRYSPGIHSDFPDAIYVNRTNQLATVLNDGTRPRGQDYKQFVMYYSKSAGMSRAYLPDEHRIFGGLAFSDWGVAFTTPDDGNEPNKVWSGRFGEPLSEVFNQWTGTISTPGINDQGVVAFASRVATNHGNRDLWRYLPEVGIESLADLGEDQLLGPTLVDPWGRVIQYHLLGAVPNQSGAIIRFEADGQWTNPLDGPGMPEKVGRPIGAGGVNAAGDFAFATNARDNGNLTFTLHAYSTATEAATPIFTTSRSLNEIGKLSIADNGNIFFRFSFSGTGYASYLYRRDENRVIDLNDLAPAGSELIDSYSPSMNQNGDLLFGVWNIAAHSYSYFLWRSDASEPRPISSLTNLPGEFHELTLSNDLTAYAWTWLENKDWVLGEMTIPEPTGPAAVVVAFGALCMGRSRRQSAALSGG